MQDDAIQAVSALIKKHKLEGNRDGWVDAYRDEMSAMISKRCRRITGDEYKRVMKHEKIVRLRMNPEPKKDGRKKCRLLVRGYTRNLRSGMVKQTLLQFYSLL